MSLSGETAASTAFETFLQEPGRSVSTKKKFRYKFKGFLKRYGKRPLAEIDTVTLEEWFDYMERRLGYSQGHLAFHRNCHKAFWKYCSQFTGSNVAANLKHYEEAPPVVITADKGDVELCLRACENMWETLPDQRDAAVFALGAAGLRRSNVHLISLRATRLALKTPVGDDMYLFTTDGKRPMEVILNGRLAKIINRYISNRPKTPHDRLFVNLNSDDSDYLNPLSVEGLQRARRRVCKRADVPLISFQKMRRLMGSTVARKYGLEIAASVLGHTSGTEVVRKHYYDPDKEAARRAAFDVLKDL